MPESCKSNPDQKNENIDLSIIDKGYKASQKQIEREERLNRDQLYLDIKNLKRSLFRSKKILVDVDISEYKSEKPGYFFKFTPCFRPLLFRYNPEQKPKQSSLTHEKIKKRKTVIITNQFVCYDSDFSNFSSLMLYHAPHLLSEHWQTISRYAAIIHIAIKCLILNYGKDSSVPDSWVDHQEQFTSEVDLNIKSQNIRQDLEQQEQAERAEIIKQERCETIERLFSPFKLLHK